MGKIIAVALLLQLLLPLASLAEDASPMSKDEWAARRAEVHGAALSGGDPAIAEIRGRLIGEAGRNKRLYFGCMASKSKTEDCWEYKLKQEHANEKIELYNQIDSLKTLSGAFESLVLDNYGKSNGWLK